MASAIHVEKHEQPKLAEHDSSVLDLVFVMDCTGSMGSYIESARENIRFIVEEIVTSEKSDIRLALVEYRDHPPQDETFVTRVHDFTAKVKEMKSWLEQCEAAGGGDVPEAVADALHAVLKLSWRAEATKICVLISDAPPHGLDPNSGDGFPEGDPSGLDPLKTAREMAEKQITLYAVGVEPPIVPYRDFFMSIAYITGGQYVPMVNAKLLSQVIIGGVREEISLERLMQNAEEDIQNEMKRAEEEGVVDDKEIATRVNRMLIDKKVRVKKLENLSGETSEAARSSYSKCLDMKELRSVYKPDPSLVPGYMPSPLGRTRAAYRAELMRSVRAPITLDSDEATATADAPPPSRAPASEMTYHLKEDEDVSLEQTERIVTRMRKKR